MGAPIVVNTVKVQGSVTAIPGSALPVYGTVSQGGTTWYVVSPDTNPTFVSGTVYANLYVGSDTAPVYTTGTVIASIPDTSPAYVAGTVSTIGTVVADAGSGTRAVSSSITNPLWVQGTVIPSGTVAVSNQISQALYVQGTTTMSSTNAGFVQGSVTALPGSAATSLGKAEDAGFTSGDVGVMALAVRNDSGTALTNANLDYSPLAVDSAGRSQVIERGSAIAHGSAAISASAQILAASGTRRTAVITNLGTDYVWLGASGVATGSGLRLAPGQTAVIDRAPQAAIHGVAQSGTQSVSYFTESD